MNNTNFPIATDYPNPIKHPALRELGVFEMIKEIINPKPRPFNCVQIEVTSCCTAKCTYCPHTTKAHNWKQKHMQINTFVNTWPLLQQANRVHLQGWGEPLLHHNFFDFVALARKAGCQVSSTSCGLHLNEEIALKIIGSGMDIVAFSLAGTDKISNSPRQGADFEKVYQGIKLLQELRQKKMAVHLELHLAYILLADRLEALFKLPKLMQELQVHATVVSTLDYLADEGQRNLAINPWDHDIISKARDILEKISEEAKQNGQQIYYALPSLIPSQHCRENIQNSLYISADGTISPCIYLNVPDQDSPKIIFGNVNEENILNIWKNKEFEDFREAHSKGNPIDQCKTCVKKFES